MTLREPSPVKGEMKGETAPAASRGVVQPTDDLAPFGVCVCSPGPINIPAAADAQQTAEVPVLATNIAAHVVTSLPYFFKAHAGLLPAGDQKPH